MAYNNNEEQYMDESEAVYYEQYEALTLEEDILRSEKGRKAAATHLAKYAMEPHQVMSKEKTSELANIIRSASNEEEIYQYFKIKPLFPSKENLPCPSW